MKRIEEAAEVVCRKGWPVSVCWRGSQWPVRRVVDYWVVRGRWWKSDEHRVYFRVESRRGLLEIYRAGDRWMVSRISD